MTLYRGISVTKGAFLPETLKEIFIGLRTFDLDGRCGLQWPGLLYPNFYSVMTHNPWKTLSSKIVYQNPWITVREDAVINPSGNEGIYGVVQSRIATGVVALTDKQEVYLVGQYRYPTEMYSWEIPEGGAEPGEEPLSAIQRELREEAGLIAKQWSQLGGEIHLSNCHSSERAFLYLARDLTTVAQEPEETEELAVKKLPLVEAIQMIADGVIVDAMTIIGLLRAQHDSTV